MENRYIPYRCGHFLPQQSCGHGVTSRAIAIGDLCDHGNTEPPAAQFTNKGARDQLSRYKSTMEHIDTRRFMRERLVGLLGAIIALRSHTNRGRAELHLRWHQIVLAKEIKGKLSRNYTEQIYAAVELCHRRCYTHVIL